MSAQPVPTRVGGYDFNHDVWERGEDTIRQLVGMEPLRTWQGRRVVAKAESVADVTVAMLRKHAHWRRAMPALHKAYAGYCAYHARYLEMIEGPTTDHFVALSTAGSGSMDTLMLAYTWSNYRLAGSYVNGVKSAIADVLDPFEIGEGWFALDLGTFKTVVGPCAPLERTSEIDRTITALKLDKDPIVTCRSRAADLYWLDEDHLPLARLAEDHPFVAAEILRQGFLRTEDAERLTRAP